MQQFKLTATALVARNTLAYIPQVFALNAARRPFVNVPDEAAASALTGLDIERCIVPDEGNGWFAEHHPLIRDDRPAQITFTSGTEGRPKGIVLSYANLADTADRLIDQMELTAEVREYVGVPVGYSFGIGRIRAISAVGGQSYLPRRGFDPNEFARMLASGEVNALSAVPTLLRVLLQTPAVIGDLGLHLRWMEIGSQYMSADEKRGIREMFPNARIVQHYGLTEASRTTFLHISDVADDQLESVGRPVGATEVEISSSGRIRIRGPHVAPWRIGTEGLVDLRDAEGWLQTNDMGHLQDGFLYYDGRADDLINCGGMKINPDLLESRIAARLGISGKVVAAKVPDSLRGEGVLVSMEAGIGTEAELRSAAHSALESLGIHAGDALHAQIVDQLPRTATGKPLRRQLVADFVSQHAAVTPASVSNSERPIADIQAFFDTFFPGRAVGPNDSFESMGGDSLNYIQFSLGFEERFGTLPSRWESLSVAELQKGLGSTGLSKNTAATDRRPWRRLEAATLTRAFFMVCIVALHLDTFVYSSNWGAAYFLYMLCGYSIMRFQWPEISRTGKVTTLIGTVVRIAIPTVLVVGVLQLWAHEFELKPALLISNWFDPRAYHVAYYYFAEIYMQLLLIVAALLLIPAVRDSLRRYPVLTCTVFLAGAMALSWAVDQVWDTNYIFHRTPIWYLWTVAAGMLIASVKDARSRISVIAIVTFAVILHHGSTSATAYIVGASAILLFWPEILVPWQVKTLIAEIASSSMFIYLSHFQVKSLLIRFLGQSMPWLALFVAIAFGIVFSRIYIWLEKKVLSHMRSRGWFRGRAHLV